VLALSDQKCRVGVPKIMERARLPNRCIYRHLPYPAAEVRSSNRPTCGGCESSPDPSAHIPKCWASSPTRKEGTETVRREASDFGSLK
jgi:hypothetical protein